MSETKPSKLNIVWASNAPVEFIEDPGNAKFQQGWVAEVIPAEYLNYTMNQFSAGIAHVNTMGIAKWDATTTYVGGSIVKSDTAGNKFEYRARVAPTAGISPQLDEDYAPVKFVEIFHGGKTLYIADRGFSKSYPENTTPALEAAGIAGFDGVRFTVRNTSDGVWVLMNDVDVDRTTNSSGNVSDLASASLAALDAGSSFDTYFAGARIPTLAEALDICKNYSMLPIITIAQSDHTDTSIDDLLTEVREVIPNYNFIIESSFEEPLEYIRSQDTEVVVSVLGVFTDAFINRASNLGNACITLNSSANLSGSRVDEVVKKRIPVMLHNVDDSDDALIRNAVTAFISSSLIKG